MRGWIHAAVRRSMRILQVPETRRRGVPRAHRKGIEVWREYVWPSMGIRAWLKWVGLTLVRQAEDAHSVALGVAIGVFVCFIPILGTHTVIAFVLCLLTGGSFLAALAGTLLGNPWTYGVMWWGSYELGYRILGAAGLAGPRVNIHKLLEGNVGLAALWADAEQLIEHVVIPALLGSVIIGVPTAACMYVLVLWQVRRWRQRRATRLDGRRQVSDALRVAVKKVEMV